MTLNAALDSATGLRRQAAERIEAEAAAVRELAHDMHAHPEISFDEYETADKVADFLAARGFTVDRDAGRLPTSFVATAGHGDFVVALCAELDALPGIGHACGHNLITGAAVAAALGLQSVADDAGITVKLIGVPAEEHGGGKVYQLQDGLFDDADCALMVHAVPDGMDCQPYGTSSTAVGRWRVTFTGQASHAAAAPELGVNAADAVVLAQVGMGLLRQQTPTDHRMNMVIREAGQETNIICARSIVDFECRAMTLDAFWTQFHKIENVFKGAALATGCDVEIEPIEPVYEPLQHDRVLSQHWCEAYGVLGHDVAPKPNQGAGSTDFGNVGQWMPGLHPWISIPGCSAGTHSVGFAEAADTDAAYTVMFDGAVAMAWTVVGLLESDEDRRYLAERKASRQPYPTGTVPGEDAVFARYAARTAPKEDK